MGAAHRARVRTDRTTLDALVDNLAGVTEADARVLIRKAIESDGAITESDIPEINRLKFGLLDSGSVLHFEYDVPDLSDVAGLQGLKDWLGERRAVLRGLPAPGTDGLDRPKGVMLLGVQGGGKSLAARAIAGEMGLPLLRLDFGNLYNKFVGETERNLREALAQAERMAPCVLWMDEIEKGTDTSGSDNATARRLLGTLLTWMSEHGARVFIVATANDISRLPPEPAAQGPPGRDLLRRPARRGRASRHSGPAPEAPRLPAGRNRPRHARGAHGGLHGGGARTGRGRRALSRSGTQCALDTSTLRSAIESTVPLSVTMAEKAPRSAPGRESAASRRTEGQAAEEESEGGSLRTRASCPSWLRMYEPRMLRRPPSQVST